MLLDQAPELLDRAASTIIRALGTPAARTRLRPTTWSPLEYACDVRDTCVIFRARIDLVLKQDDPTFPNWDQDATAVESRYDKQKPEIVATSCELARRGRRRSSHCPRAASTPFALATSGLRALRVDPPHGQRMPPAIHPEPKSAEDKGLTAPPRSGMPFSAVAGLVVGDQGSALAPRIGITPHAAEADVARQLVRRAGLRCCPAVAMRHYPGRLWPSLGLLVARVEPPQCMASDRC